MRRIRGGSESVYLRTAQPKFPAQPLDPQHPGRTPVVPQFHLEALRSIHLPSPHMYPTRILLGAFRGPAGRVAASGHLPDPTEQGQGMLLAQRRHACVPGNCAFATYAVALLRCRAPYGPRRARASAENLRPGVVPKNALATDQFLLRAMQHSLIMLPR